MREDTTVERVRSVLMGRDDVVEKRIVGGGLGFMVGGHLCCAATPRGLTVRIGRDAKAIALTEPHVRPHTVGTRETAAFVIVQPEGYASEETLAGWIDRGLRFVSTLS